MGAATLSAALNERHREMVGPITIIVLILAAVIIFTVAWDEFGKRK